MPGYQPGDSNADVGERGASRSRREPGETRARQSVVRWRVPGGAEHECHDESPDGVTRLDDVRRKPVSWRRRNSGQTSLPPGGGGVLWRRTDGRHSTCTRVLPEVLRALPLYMGNRNHGNSWKRCQRSENADRVLTHQRNGFGSVPRTLPLWFSKERSAPINTTAQVASR